MQYRSRFFLKVTMLGFGIFTATGANAALVSVLGGQAVNDTDLNITWLANPNLAYSNNFGVTGILSDGSMNWYTAQSWIGAMNAANYLGYSDWRLPTTLLGDTTCNGTPSYGANCTGSEMGHLFYTELGGQANSIIAVTHNDNYNLFSSPEISNGFWSGTSDTVDTAFDFYFGYSVNTAGYQGSMYKPGNYIHAWAVRTGQVVVTPIPAAAWLFGSGLLGLVGFARKRKVV